MANAAQPQPKQDYLAGFLSYLMPGLGQIYQGRITKGILFLVCVYGLFFYGMSLGSWSNVFLPRSARGSMSLYDDFLARPQFLGQFWAGVVVWPAIYQYLNFNDKESSGPIFGTWQRTPYESREGDESVDKAPNLTSARRDWEGKTLNELQTEGDKSYDLGWVYTVIAGVLNILVIYDAVAGPAFGAEALARAKEESEKNADGAVVTAG